MSGSDLRVDGIDHVELVVPDPGEAAAWYGDALGLTVCEEYEQWAAEAGPLMISSDGGATKLALFEGDPETDGEPTGYARVAYRTDADGFLTFVDGDVPRVEGADRADIVDHDLSFSVYFEDPYGHRCEVTTYEYERVAERL